MNIEKVLLQDLKPLENNVRKHNEKQIDELIRSVKQFDQTRALVIDENNNILIGNGLYLALEKMGETECFCFRKTGLTETEKKKLVLSDNKVYALGADDYDNIDMYVKSITETGDFDIAGFDTTTLEMMTMTYEDNEEDMKSYGTVTEQRYTEEQPAQPINNIPKVETPLSAPQASQSAPTIQAHEATAPQRRSVVCPNCGEVIYID